MFQDVLKEGKNDVKFVLAIYVVGEYAYYSVRYHLIDFTVLWVMAGSCL